MRIDFRYFILGLLTFILSFFFIDFINSPLLLAGQLESEFSLISTSGNEVIIDDFLVNDDTISLDNQIKPAIARNLNGDFIVVWADFREDYLGDIYAQRFDPSGIPIGSNFKVNSDIASAEQHNPKVGVDSSGNFVIAWEDRRFGNSDIYVQRFDSSGVPLGSNMRVNSDAGVIGQYSPDIAMGGSGYFIITWTDFRNGNADIYAQRYSSSGNFSGSNFIVNDDSGITYQEYPAITFDGYRNFIITWQDYRNRNWDIYAQIYDSSGVPTGDNFRIDQDAGVSYQKSPDISSDFSGNFFVTWRDERNGNSDIYANRFDSTGLPLDSDFKVNDDNGNTYQGFPSVSSDSSGNFIITWTDYRNGNRDVYAQRYSFSGNPMDMNFKINDDTGDAYQEYPDVSIDDSGDFVLTWQDLRKGNYNIFIQRFDSAGIPIGYNFMVNDDFETAFQLYPVVGVDDFGNFTLIWQDYRYGNWDIYTQRFDFSGNFLGSNLKVNDDSGTAHQRYPALAIDSYGNIIIVWQDNRNGDWEIYAQSFNSSGVPLGSNFKVDSLGGTSPDIAIDGAGNFIIVWENRARRFDSSGAPIGTYFTVSGTHPDIAMDDSGNFVITWVDGRNGSYNLDIYAQRYNSKGIPIGLDFRVNDDTVYDYQREPDIDLDNDDNFVITWRDYRNGDWDIYAQRFDNTGMAIGANFKVNDDAGASNQWSPRVVMAEDGTFIVTWHDYRNFFSDIYAQRYDSSGVPSGGNYLVVNPQFASFEQVNPSIISSGSNLYFTWADNRRGNWDIYAKVVDLTWTKVGEELQVSLPVYFDLSQNYPNPFNHTTTIPFQVDGSRLTVLKPIQTTLTIYNILGQKIKTLINEEILPGEYQVSWHGKDEKGLTVSSGVYFYRLRAGESVQTRKMIFLK